MTLRHIAINVAVSVVFTLLIVAMLVASMTDHQNIAFGCGVAAVMLLIAWITGELDR